MVDVYMPEISYYSIESYIYLYDANDLINK
jgi:hypothetical protein